MVLFLKVAVLAVLACSWSVQAEWHFNIYLERFQGERCGAGEQIDERTYLHDGTYSLGSSTLYLYVC